MAEKKFCGIFFCASSVDFIKSEFLKIRWNLLKIIKVCKNKKVSICKKKKKKNVGVWKIRCEFFFPVIGGNFKNFKTKFL